MRWWVLALLSTAACSSFGADDATPRAPAADAGGATTPDASAVPEGGTSGDGGVDGAAPADDLLRGAGSFENGTICGDGSWDAFQGTMAVSPTAHAGEQSCRVCANLAQPVAYPNAFTLNAPSSLATGNRYHAELWVRQDGAHPTKAILIGRQKVPEHATSSNILELTQTWAFVQVDFDVTRGPETAVDAYLELRELGGDGNDACVFVDDFRVWKTN